MKVHFDSFDQPAPENLTHAGKPLTASQRERLEALGYQYLRTKHV